MQLTKNFSLKEFVCHDGTPVPEKYIANIKTLALNLQILRDYLNEIEKKPIFVKIISGYRTISHNREVGGVDNSQHLKGKAADIRVYYKDGDKIIYLTPMTVKRTIELLISENKMHNGGLGLYPSFVHYDIRPNKARW